MVALNLGKHLVQDRDGLLELFGLREADGTVEVDLALLALGKQLQKVTACLA